MMERMILSFVGMALSSRPPVYTKPPATRMQAPPSNATAAVVFDPGAKRDMHRHEETLLVYARRGMFILNTEEGARRFSRRETCLVVRGVLHAEEAGPKGAEILAVRK